MKSFCVKALKISAIVLGIIGFALAALGCGLMALKVSFQIWLVFGMFLVAVEVIMWFTGMHESNINKKRGELL